MDVRCLEIDETQYFSLAGRLFLSTEQTIDVTKFSFIQGDFGRAPTSGLSWPAVYCKLTCITFGDSFFHESDDCRSVPFV